MASPENNHTTKPKPPRLEIVVENIPQEIKDKERWVIWKWTWNMKEKKWEKPPMDAKTGFAASSTNPKTWSSFQVVYDKYKNFNWDGIGFVLNGEYTGEDFDDCRNPATGQIFEPALSEIANLNSYTEVSPSLTGCKALTKAKLPKGGHHKNGHGVFDTGRYFCITGHIIEGVSPNIESRQEEVNKLVKKYWPKDFEEKEKPPPSPKPPSIEDSDLTEKIRRSAQGSKFDKLWSGNYSDYPSWSEADLALCSMLAFWTGNNAAQIDQLFRQSGLMRKKWDEKHFSDGRTYGQATIQKAIEQTLEVYMGNTLINQINSLNEEVLAAPKIKIDPNSKTAKTLLGYNLTDAGNAECFKELFGNVYVFVPEKKMWLAYDGIRWGEDDQHVILRMLETVRIRAKLAMNLQDPDKMKAIVKWSFASEANMRLKAALSIAEPMLKRSYNDFDKDPWLLCCLNGAVDLRTGKLKNTTKGDWLYKSTNIAFYPETQCPRYLQFLQEIFAGDDELIDFIWRAIGYTLTGKTKEQCLFINCGIGANGKSVFLAVLEGLLGEYAQTTPSSTFKEKFNYDSIPNDIARMAGARFVKAIEIKEGAKLNEERIKALTGGDRITARFLHNEFFEFTPIAKFWISVNHKPIIRGTDEAIWRRIRLIPFEVTFPQDKQDKDLIQTLQKELPGILAWAVKGCLEWQNRGLEPVTKVKKATQTYREESDVIAQFIEEMTAKSSTGRVKGGELYNSYVDWCRKNGEYAVTQSNFGRRVEERGFTKEKKKYVYYLGMELQQ
jgi:putative DNA primase/helicase